MTSGAAKRCGAVAFLCISSVAGTATAVEVKEVGDETLTLDVTNTAIGNYLFDNRNASAGLTPPSTIVDDHYGEFINHLNAQLFYWRFRVGVRIDGYAYGGLPDDEDFQKIAKERLPDGSGVDRYEYENAFRRELHTRFRNTIYPTKINVGYTAPGVDITFGDFYAQLGRGIVLSVRKIDELAQDTTIRGFKASFKKSFDDASLSVTALAGQANPLRVDDQSGRQLTGDGSPLFFGFPEADDFTFYSFDQQGNAGYTTVPARPSYLEDTIYGLSVEAGPKQILFGAHASLLKRKSYSDSFARCERTGQTNCGALFPTFVTNNVSRLHELIMTASGSIRVPNIFDHGDLYAEAAVQYNGDGRAKGLDENGEVDHVEDLTGYGVYVTGTIRGGPVTVTLEGKHYRSILPLAGNINADGAADPTFAAPEFDTVTYNQPPNADTFYQEPIGSPNVCITGGRARTDYRMTNTVTAYAWLGYFVSESEVNANNTQCDTDDPTAETHTIDAASGGEMVFDEGKSHFTAWVGGRNTVRAEPVEAVNLGGESDVFYREGYVRYDIAKHLAGDFTLVSQGFHRHRYEPTLSPNWWNEGENYLALRWAPYFSFIFGFEYLGRRGCSADSDTGTCFYFNGGVQFKSANKDSIAEMIFDTVNLFVGQRRGAIRCVAGVCRPFPPFEGAKLELTSRF
ncbi:MAG: hypothetical protein HOW73_10395 [Polyangiaceae bacterium]|nr:hypothetical protein [Polyangiaceae bacterium]